MAAATARKSLSLLRARAWVGGSWISAASGGTFSVVNPSNGQKLADVADMGAEDMDTAIARAHEAQKSWAATTSKVSGYWLVEANRVYIFLTFAGKVTALEAIQQSVIVTSRRIGHHCLFGGCEELP